MYRIDNATAAASLAAATADGVNPGGFWTNGDPGSGTPATTVDAEFMNMIQEEIANVIEDADAGNTALSKASRTQLKNAILAMIAASGASLPAGSRGGGLITYTSATTVTIPSGYFAVSDSGNHLIEFASSQAVAITTSGANGLQTTSSEANNTSYFLYAIDDTTGVNTPKGLLVPSGAAITLPSGYDVKAKTGIVVRNNASSNFIPFFSDGVYEYYETSLTSDTSDDTNIIYGGSAASFTDLDLSAYVPLGSTVAIVVAEHNISNTESYIRRNGESHNGIQLSENDDHAFPHVVVQVDSSRVIEYKTTGNLDLSVKGFLMPY